MKVNEINGRKIKISKTSITVKDENGKTCGVIRNIIRFKDLQMNRQIDYFKNLRSCGIWGSGSGLIDNFVIIDSEPYYFTNKNTQSEKNKLIAEKAEKFFNVIYVQF